MKILILRTDRIGDVILSEPVIEVIASKFNNPKIDVALSEYSAPVLYGNPHISNIYKLSSRGIKDAFNLANILKRNNYDLSITIDTHPISYLIPYLSKVKVRIGQGRRLWGVFLNYPVSFSRRHSNLHEVVLNQMLLKQFGHKPELKRPELYISQDEVVMVIDSIKKLGYEEGRPIIIIHPGSLGSSAHPPLKIYKKLSETVSRYGQVVIVGRREFDNLDGFRDIENILVIDDIDIREYMALISQAVLFIGGDTGPMHIASAFNIPVIALFSPIRGCGPERWGPLSDKYIIYKPDIEECNGKCDRCKYYNCMEKIDAFDIISGVMSLVRFKEV